MTSYSRDQPDQLTSMTSYSTDQPDQLTSKTSYSTDQPDQLTSMTSQDINQATPADQPARPASPSKTSHQLNPMGITQRSPATS